MGKARCIGVDNLPEELLLNVMSRLGTRNLCISSCVCKQWSNLVSNILQKRSEQNPRLLMAKKEQIQSIIQSINSHKLPQLSSLGWDELNDDSIEPRYESYASENLIGYSSNRFTADANAVVYFDDGYEHHCYLYNTISKEFFALPDCSCPVDYDIMSVAFGYLASTKEFKVAGWFNKYDVICKIITVGKNDDWRVINCPFKNINICCQQGLMGNEAFHWMICDCSYGENDPIIVSLNLVTEELTTILPPPYHSCEVYDHPGMAIGSLRGFFFLSCQQKSAAGLDKIMEIWLLKQNKLWEREFNIILMPNWFCHGPCPLVPLYEHDGDLLLCGIWDNELLFYDTERKIMRQVGGQIKKRGFHLSILSSISF
ncbi:F-box protein [Quillaja saponaria]|uniref:F-box protein n=1 Tax=Quillaja saponaria TaxID=32244 RepID=A0AAD7Q9D3_QUISA|nr:F-box protein [Quillaja saponaria]